MAPPCPSKDLDAPALSLDNAGTKPEEPGLTARLFFYPVGVHQFSEGAGGLPWLGLLTHQSLEQVSADSEGLHLSVYLNACSEPK